MFDFDGTARRRRWLGLALVVLAHALMVLAWRPMALRDTSSAQRETEVLLLPDVLPKPTAPTAAAAPGPRSRAVPPRPSKPSTEATLTLDPAPPAPVQPEVPAAPTTVDPAALLESSRKLAGGADQQLRKEKADRGLVLKEEVDRVARMKETNNDYSDVPAHATMLNGDRLDRVSGPFGTYCVRTVGNRPSGAHDGFKDVGKQFTVNCPSTGPLSDNFFLKKKKR